MRGVSGTMVKHSVWGFTRGDGIGPDRRVRFCEASMVRHAPRLRARPSGCGPAVPSLTVAIIGALWFPLRAYPAKLVIFPFFYWYQLILVSGDPRSVLISYLLLLPSRPHVPRTARPLDARRGSAMNHLDGVALTVVGVSFLIVTCMLRGPGCSRPRPEHLNEWGPGRPGVRHVLSWFLIGANIYTRTLHPFPPVYSVAPAGF